MEYIFIALVALFSGQPTGTIEVPHIIDTGIGIEGGETTKIKMVESYIFEVEEREGHTKVWFESLNHEGYIYIEEFEHNQLHIYGWYDDQAFYHTYDREQHDYHSWSGTHSFELTPHGFETDEGVIPYYKVGIVSKKL